MRTPSKPAPVFVPWRPDFNAPVYVLGGNGSVGPRPSRSARAAQVFGAGDHIVIEGDRRLDGLTETLETLILGGPPIRETTSPMARP
jgi:hypothetical protein